MRAGGPASESLQGRKPRVGETLATRGGGLWVFGDGSSRSEWFWRRIFAFGESGGPVWDWHISVEWRLGGAKGREIGRAHRLRCRSAR